MGFGITIPAVPIFARDIGTSYMGIGLVGVAYGLSYTILAIPLGRLYDRVGRKATFTFASILSVVASLAYVFASRTEHLMLARAVEGVAWASFFPSVEATSADLSSEKRHGKVIGIFAALYGSGYAFGCLISGSIVEIVGYEAAFISYALVSFAGLILMTMRSPGNSTTRTITVERIIGTKIIEMGVSNTLFYACFLSVIYSVVLATILFLFPVYAKELGFGVFSIGAMLTIFWISRIASFLILGRVSDTVGRTIVLLPALFAMAIGSVLIVIGDTRALFSSVVILGLSTGAIFPATIALISDRVSENRRGTAMGLFETASAAGQMIAPLVGGYLAETFEPTSPYVFCAVISLACGVVFFRLRKVLSPNPKDAINS